MLTSLLPTIPLASISILRPHTRNMYMTYITPRYRHVISLCSAFQWDLPHISKMAHVGRLNVRLQLMGFTTFPRRIFVDTYSEDDPTLLE